jgi:hypothetical protein
MPKDSSLGKGFASTFSGISQPSEVDKQFLKDEK